MKIGSLCTGYGGLDMAVESAFGATTAWVSDIDKGACKILAHRFPDVPNLGDMTAINWAAVEPVDIITGGTPCQDLSHAGKRAGMTEGTRSNLWVQMREAIATIRPTWVIWENVRGAYSAAADSSLEWCPGCMGDPADRGPVLRALGRVLGDLSELGFDAEWRGLRAADVGAPHGRFRVFVVARAAHAESHELRRIHKRGIHAEPQRARAGAAPDPESVGRREGWPESAGILGRSDAPERSRSDLTLLPTPIPFHAGNEEDVEEWRERRADVFERTGTRHGPALSVIAKSIEAGDPLTPDRYMPDRLLPTPTVQDGENTAGPSPFDRNSLPLNAEVTLLPTPVATDASAAGNRPTDKASHPGTSLTDATIRQPDRWGDYAPAIARWETVLDRPAPDPTEATGRDGAPRLSATFTEWLMGVPAGWIADTPGLTRNEALKACGNGVVPQQAYAAIVDALTAFEGDAA